VEGYLRIIIEAFTNLGARGAGAGRWRGLRSGFFFIVAENSHERVG